MNIGVVAGVFFSGEAVEAVSGSSSTFLGGLFFFRVTSVYSVFFFSWTFSVSFWVPLFSLLMVAVEAVVAAVSVAAVAAAAFGGFFPGQNFEICPSCLQLHQRGRLPSTITIICLSLLIIISGMAWNPSLVKLSRNR